MLWTKLTVQASQPNLAIGFTKCSDNVTIATLEATATEDGTSAIFSVFVDKELRSQVLQTPRPPDRDTQDVREGIIRYNKFGKKTQVADIYDVLYILFR